MLQFARRMDLNARGVRALAQVALQDVVRETAFEVIQRTPVDTGQARTNWIGSIGSASERTVDTAGRAPQQAFRASVLPTILAIRANDTVFIVNALDYIGDLNRGKSPQAPAGFFQQAVFVGFRKGVARLARRRLEEFV